MRKRVQIAAIMAGLLAVIIVLLLPTVDLDPITFRSLVAIAAIFAILHMACKAMIHLRPVSAGAPAFIRQVSPPPHCGSTLGALELIRRC